MAWAALVDDHYASHDDLQAWLDQPWAPLRDSWGTSPEAVAGHKAMMALAGGPAPPRPRAKTQEPAGSA